MFPSSADEKIHEEAVALMDRIDVFTMLNLQLTEQFKDNPRIKTRHIRDLVQARYRAASEERARVHIPLTFLQ